DLHRLEHGLGLVHRLLVLAGGDRIGDDAGAGLDVKLAVLPDDGAQGDASVHVAGEVDVADGAAVGSAARRLDLVDDLHGADLGRAADGADRETHAEGVKRRAALLKLAGDVAGDVHHVAVALDGHHVADLDAADPAHPADVVAAQV